MDAVFFALMLATIVVSVRRGNAAGETPSERAPSIGPSATLDALRRMIELCPTEPAIAVVDRRGAAIGFVPVARVRALPSEIVAASVIIVADVMTQSDGRRAQAFAI